MPPYDYVFAFASSSLAIADGQVGGYVGTRLDSAITNPVVKNYGVTSTSYYMLVSSPTINSLFLSDTALQFAVDRGKMNSGQNFILSQKVSNSVLDGITISPSFSVSKFPYGTMATVPAGAVSTNYFGGFIYNATSPYGYSSAPFGFQTFGRTPGGGWPYIQPSGSSQWFTSTANYFENVYTYCAANGIDVVFSMGNAPGWTVADHSSDNGAVNGVTGQWVTCLCPDNPADIDTFLNTFLTKYNKATGTVAKCVTAIETYVEPANSNPAGGSVPIAQCVAFCNRVTSYIKTNWPDIKVTTPSIQDVALASGHYYYDYFAAGGTANVDVVAWHNYNGITVGTTVNNNVEDIVYYNNLTTFNQFFGLSDLPVWDTEGSWGVDSNYNGFAGPPAPDTTAFVAQRTLQMWSLGQARQYWYALSGFGWGTMASTVAPLGNSAGIAYRTVKGWMTGATLQRPGISISSNGTTYAGTWSLSSGGTAVSVWDTSTSGIIYTPPSSYGYYTDLTGTKSSVTSSGTILVYSWPQWLSTS